jgi:hypothetical protein
VNRLRVQKEIDRPGVAAVCVTLASSGEQIWEPRASWCNRVPDKHQSKQNQTDHWRASMAVRLPGLNIHMKERTTGFFATVWQPSKCTCNNFQIIEIDGELASTFTMRLATEQTFTCATVSTARHKMAKYVTDLWAKLPPPFLIGGVVNANQNTVHCALGKNLMGVTCQIIPSMTEQWPSPLMMTMLAPHSISRSDTTPVPHCLTINISLSNTDADGCERKETHTDSHHVRESVGSANASGVYFVETNNPTFVQLHNVVSLLVTIAGIRFDNPSSDLIACAETVVFNGAVLTDDSLNKLSEITDIIHFHKDGTCKDTVELLRFYEWCNNVRQAQIGFATEHAESEVDLDETQVSQCFHAFVEEFCHWELTPPQRRNAQYWPNWDSDGKMSLPRKLRGVINSVIRTKLGNKWVPFRIWQIGAPCILTGEIEYDVQRAPSENVLQSHLKHLLSWFVALANDVVARENSEGFGMHQQMSQLDKPPLVQGLMQSRKRAHEDLLMGKQLQKQREQGWDFNEMTPEHQRQLEDFETERAQTRSKRLAIKPLATFRSSS